MRRNLLDHQAMIIENCGLRRIQLDRQILYDEFLVCAKGFLIRERATIAYQQVHEARSLGEKPAAVGAKNAVGDGAVARESTRVEEGREIAAVVNVQVRQQDGIHAR